MIIFWYPSLALFILSSDKWKEFRKVNFAPIENMQFDSSLIQIMSRMYQQQSTFVCHKPQKICVCVVTDFFIRFFWFPNLARDCDWDKRDSKEWGWQKKDGVNRVFDLDLIGNNGNEWMKQYISNQFTFFPDTQLYSLNGLKSGIHSFICGLHHSSCYFGTLTSRKPFCDNREEKNGRFSEWNEMDWSERESQLKLEMIQMQSRIANWITQSSKVHLVWIGHNFPFYRMEGMNCPKLQGLWTRKWHQIYCAMITQIPGCIRLISVECNHVWRRKKGRKVLIWTFVFRTESKKVYKELSCDAVHRFPKCCWNHFQTECKMWEMADIVLLISPFTVSNSWIFWWRLSSGLFKSKSDTTRNTQSTQKSKMFWFKTQ